MAPDVLRCVCTQVFLCGRVLEVLVLGPVVDIFFSSLRGVCYICGSLKTHIPVLATGLSLSVNTTVMPHLL